jgi:hypothetical protein
MKETLGGALVMLCGRITPSLELMQVRVLRNGNVKIVSSYTWEALQGSKYKLGS